MQNVSSGDNLHEIKSCFLGKNKKNIINLSSAELAQRSVVKVKLNQQMTNYWYLSLYFIKNISLDV